MKVAISQIRKGGTSGIVPVVTENIVTGYEKMTCIVPAGVTSIGNYAFSFCSPLQSITLPESLTSIGNSAFSYCSALQSITLASATPRFDQELFGSMSDYTELASVVVPQDWKPTYGDYGWNICLAFPALTIATLTDIVGNLGTWTDGDNTCTVYLNGARTTDEGYADLVSAIEAKGYTVSTLS